MHQVNCNIGEQKEIPEAATGGVLSKKVLLKISKTSQKNTCARVSYNKNSNKNKRLWHRCFSVNFAEFLKHLIYKTPLGDCF